MYATSLKGRHIDVLLQRWKAESLSAGTLKNRLTHLRGWAEKVGKAGILPTDNTRLDIPERHSVRKENKAKGPGGGLDRISGAPVCRSLELQATFGLCREESIQFRPSLAGQDRPIALQGS